jgi:hypothetical protein
MMQVAAYFIDNKLFTYSIGNRLKDLLIRFAGWLYRPVARLRYRYGLAGMLVEYRVYQLAVAGVRRYRREKG